MLAYNSSTKKYEPADVADLDGVVVLDQDDMSDDSATAVPSQQSTKAYVDNSIGAKVKAVLHTTLGGAADEDVTIAGVAATDVVSAVIHTAGGTPRTISKVVAGTGKVTITFSGDPSTTHVVNVIVVKP